MEKNNELPRGWTWIHLDEISEKIVDGTHFTPTYVKTGIPFISVKDIKENKISFDNCRYISEDEYQKLSLRCNPEFNDILITKSGTIGRTAVVKSTNSFSLFVSVALIKPLKMYIDSYFLAFALEHYINSIDIQQDVKGGVIKNLHIEDLRLIQIPLAPLNEQKRIVSKIEELFSKIDSAKQSIANTQIQLKLYKQSLLKSAFEGKLIPMTSKDLTSEIPLEKIEDERRKIFEETQNMRKEGKKINYESPREPFKNDENLFCKSWKSVSIETICSVVASGSTPLRSVPENFDQKGIPLIKVENIMDDGTVRLRNDQLRIRKEIHQKHWKSIIRPNDVLINIVGMPLGKIGLVQSDIPEANINQAIVVMRTMPLYLPKTLLYCLLSPNYYDYQINMSTGVRQSNIKKSSVGRIPIPLIPIQYQTKMIEKIEKGLSLTKNSIDITISMLDTLNVLKQSILKQAFEGKLVPQDPNDESVEALLQKIKQEKEKLHQIQKVNKSTSFKSRRAKNVN